MAVKQAPTPEPEAPVEPPIQNLSGYVSDPSDPDDSIKEAAYHAAMVAEMYPDPVAETDEAE